MSQTHPFNTCLRHRGNRLKRQPKLLAIQIFGLVDKVRMAVSPREYCNHMIASFSSS